MKLTPLDIKKQEFKKSLRGFDVIEVETFLEMIAEQYENVIREKNNLADEVLQLRTQLHDYKDVEKTLKETLMTAQQTVNHSRENSAKEAESIIHSAEIKAENILQETKLQLSELRNDIVLLKAQKESFGRRLRHLLESQLELMEVLELDDLGFRNFEEKRYAHKPAPVKTHNEIEFEGVDEVMPEEDVSDIEPEASIKTEIIDNSNWPEQSQQHQQPKQTEETQKSDTDPENKSRISDHLIF